jgi:glycosyltransferase involved in cell wall biosynthesis
MRTDTPLHSAEGGLRLSAIVPVFNERYLVRELLRRLLAVSIPGIAEVEVIVVDDASTDGSGEIVDSVAAEYPGRVKVHHHETNQGKGAAIRTGIEAATGDLIVFQDADLEYDPEDLAKLVAPFLEDGADVVYGSRFLSGDRRRVLYFRHTLGNRLITFLSNWATDLNLTDVETCYKMVRGPLLKSIPIRSNDFRMEIELTAKFAKRNCRIFEVPISYSGRTYQEGKKIGWKDGFKALWAIERFWMVDDLYKQDEYGGTILHALERAQRFNGWMADAVRPMLGSRVLEIGAGIGNLTSLFVPRDRYFASDINPAYLAYLQNLSVGKPYLEVSHLDLDKDDGFDAVADQFDTVICLNVLEHVPDPVAALQRMRGALQPGGKLVLYVPVGPGLYSSLDESLGHRCRYSAQSLKAELEIAGLQVEETRPFNRVSVPAWWFNGKVLRRRSFSRFQLKLFDLMVPILRRLDRFLPWPSLGLIAVARRPD